MQVLCPCCSGLSYSSCCKKFHDGAYPKNALELMRSRYTAYAFNNAEYIIRTTHPNNPKYKQNKEKWKKEIQNFSENTQFIQLEILEFKDGAQEAYVTFVAHLIQNNAQKKLIEKSQFVKVGAQWLYFDGVYK